jgi:hypothetical protein
MVRKRSKIERGEHESVEVIYSISEGTRGLEGDTISDRENYPDILDGSFRPV